jgi:GH25 family lysozyme M1 (1,4-beta-N-acetylmuramidase)
VATTIYHDMPESKADRKGAVTEYAKAGHAGGDHDLQGTKDAHLVLSHDATFDGHKIADLTLAEFMLLPGAQSVYGALDEAKAATEANGRLYIPFFERKPGWGANDARSYQRLKDYADKIGQPFGLMTLRRYPYDNSAKALTWEAKAVDRMRAMRSVGLPCGVLWHPTSGAGSVVTDHNDPLIQVMAWGKTVPTHQWLPQGIVRVPQNSKDYATALAVLQQVAYTPEVPVVTPLRIDGADLSHFQSGALDFAAFAAAGGRFVYHKATEGDTVTDALYGQRMGEVRAAGLMFGAYHYAHPDSSSGTDQAARFLAAAKPMPGDLLPALDLEVTGGLSQPDLTKWVGQFVGEVKRQLGVLPVIYTNKNLASDFGCPLWVARYSNSNAAPIMPTPFTRISIRQFSNGVYGVPKSAPGLGAVDLDTLPDGVNLADLLIPTADPTPPPEVPPVADDRYDRVTFRGRLMDKWTRQALLACEDALGYTLTVTQGSFNAGRVSASAGTHDGGGVVDLAPYDWAKKVRVLREHGFAAWHRTPIPNVWPEHIHAVLIGDTSAAPSAQRQVAAYRNGRNGLANNGPDDGPRVPINEFSYDPRRFDDMDEATLRKVIAEECDKAVKKYVGDVVASPTATDPKNTVWVSTALARLLKKTGA